MTLFLLAQIAGASVAIDANQVESVVDIGAITPAPRAPAIVRGLAALRSRVVTVLDPRVALGLPPSETTTRAVIVRVEGHHYALLVDGLDDVAPFDLEPLANGLTIAPGWREICRGVVTRGDEPVLAIDLAALIPGAVTGALAA
jgi:purine-binding chemotaxis protein CheW